MRRLCDPVNHRDLKDLISEIQQSYDRWYELTMAIEDDIFS
jgi:hypothetical protein